MVGFCRKTSAQQRAMCVSSCVPAPGRATMGRRSEVACAARSQSSTERRVLCVFPRYTPSFGTFEHAYKLMGVNAFMPPQGLLLIAAYLPESGTSASSMRISARPPPRVRLGGRGVRQRHARPAPRCWISPRAPMRRQGRACSAARRSPRRQKFIPDFDYLHIGEIGDATDALIATLDEIVAAARATALRDRRAPAAAATFRSRPTT